MINFEKINPIEKPFYKVFKGDVIESYGEFFAFEKFPRGGKNWYGKSMKNGKLYRIPMVDKFKIVGKFVENTEKVIVKKTSNNTINLQKGDLFVIKYGRGENAELFRFFDETDKKVVAINPITNKKYKIDKTFVMTKIDNLPY